MTSKLHIPRAPFRPGDTPDFSNLQIPEAGSLERPSVDARAREMDRLADGLIRVLDSDGNAVGSWDPRLESDVLVSGLRFMMHTRAYDDRMLRMHRQGKISFYMKCTGEEAVSVAQALALRPGDMLFPTYRQQGLQIVREHPIVDMMCQCLSNVRDRCKGRQMPIMYTWKPGNILSISGSVGTQFPQAVGWAMGAAYKGQDNIAAGWIGEGSTAEPDFHHALTFAGVFQAPVILNVVNNQWAISTYQGFAGGERRTFASRAHGYDMPGLRVDGNDFLAVFSATQWAAERARNGGGPTLIELFTYRAAAHSTSDDPSRYRPKDEWKHWPLGDPIERLKQHLIGIDAWTEEQHQALEVELKEQVVAAWKEAESYGILGQEPRPPVRSMFEDVFKDMPDHLQKQLRQLEGQQDG